MNASKTHVLTTLRRAARRRLHARHGFTLIEILVVLALAALVLSFGVPALDAWHRDLRVRMAAAEVVGAMQTARLWAIRHSAHVAIKFRTDPDGRVSQTLYRDGDGDGVRNADIASGVDPQVRSSRTLAHFGHTVRFGFPPDMVPRDPGTGRPMNRLDDPIRFNNTDLASFSPLGTSTPGSVYLTDGSRVLAAVRVDYRVGRMRVLVYDPDEQRWYRD